ncbi:hypothetical protein CBS101457_002268 [Exobasidium rhododendri]|nr:hypothetical protein CBS101457_002268 [Exobasidium rhododendri]
MAFNPLAILHERQCAPIYNALDSGNPSSALKQCDGLLSSQPDLYLATALKAIALLRLGQRDRAAGLADILIKSQATIKSPIILSPLCIVLSSLDRAQDEVELLDAASKASPTSVDIGSKAFLAMVKARQWQSAQQTALRLHKLVSAKNKKDDEYFWSSMQAYSLVANDATLPGHQLALPLAQRMIAKHLESHPFGPKSDEIMYLYATILRKQGMNQAEEALKLLSDGGNGRDLCKRSMTLAALRYDLMEELHDWRTIYEEGMAALKKGDRNWSRVQEAVKGAVNLAVHDPHFSLVDIETGLLDSAVTEGKGNRTLQLASLYLVKEIRQVDTLADRPTKSNLLELFTAYFRLFCTKACAYEDLADYVPLLSEQEAQSATQFLQVDAGLPSSRAFEDLDQLYRHLNACKLVRLMQAKVGTTEDSEMKAALGFFSLYLCALPIGKDLPKTEMQPADDFALLCVQSLIHASALQRLAGKEEGTSTLYLAVVILQCALLYCPKGYRLRVLLIRLLKQCGASDLARREYDELGIKAIQQDTLGWIVSSRSASTVMMAKTDSKEEETLAGAVRGLQKVWKEARTQVPQMICKSFGSGIYSRVEEMVDFGDRLENSLAKWLVTVETARSEALQTAGNKTKDGVEKLKSDLQDCNTSLAKSKVSDQQDYHVLLDLMPAECCKIGTLTSSAAAKDPGLDYLQAMLPVASVHLNLALPQGKAADSKNEEITPEELSLSRLAVAILAEDEAVLDSRVSQVFVGEL